MRIIAHFPFAGPMWIVPQTQSGLFGLLWPLAHIGFAQPSNNASAVPHVHGISAFSGCAVLPLDRHEPAPESSARSARIVVSFMAATRASTWKRRRAQA